MQNFTRKAFTLVELLIVIGIIGVLAVTLMLSLNPVEAQKKARDAARLKDVSTIQSVLEQAINDGLTPCGTICRSSGSNNTQYSCSANWLGINVCAYARAIPGDPQNNRTSRCTNGAGLSQTGCTMAYYVQVSGADYEIDVRQESTTNATKVAQDGGNNTYFVETFTGNNAGIIGAAQNP